MYTTRFGDVSRPCYCLVSVRAGKEFSYAANSDRLSAQEKNDPLERNTRNKLRAELKWMTTMMAPPHKWYRIVFSLIFTIIHSYHNIIHSRGAHISRISLRAILTRCLCYFCWFLLPDNVELRWVIQLLVFSGYFSSRSTARRDGESTIHRMRKSQIFALLYGRQVLGNILERMCIIFHHLKKSSNFVDII